MLTDKQLIILIAGLIVIIVMIGIFILLIIKKINKKPQNEDIFNQLEKLKQEVSHQLELMNLKSKSDIKNELNIFKDAISSKVTLDVTSINEKVENRLKEGFSTTDKIFKEMAERLLIIDTTQKNIEKLSINVDDLSKLLSDKQLRGAYGEAQLYQILDNVLGTNNKVVYEKQKKLSTNVIVDAIVYGPEGIGNIPIDSKFPLENYSLMNNENLTNDERLNARKEFRNNIKTHIDNISKKYIIDGETSLQALMFIPSEAVFIEIQSNFSDLIEYAQKSKIWIVSPNTLVYMLTMILVIGQHVERQNNVEKMLYELKNLNDDYKRLFDRWVQLNKIINHLNEQVKLVDIPIEKLKKKVNLIEKAEFDSLNENKHISD
ncbi:DNA recombination protein RmuC [Acholeplasma granularum]|uniref:DNA recombination protein RmuC n=1 Tax=Acholeplasma granularum TaxID=264635 RepID=UPI0004B88544|nr:DNA recombination protein RmuC [Acholeplasma granularum]